MKTNALPKPTEAELNVLRVLWDRGPSTVHEIHEVLNRRQAAAYTTVLKFCQILHQKGLVLRDNSQRSHVYTASQSQADTQQQLVDYLLDWAFAGSSPELVMRALSSKRTSPEELTQIRKLLDGLEKA